MKNIFTQYYTVIVFIISSHKIIFISVLFIFLPGGLQKTVNASGMSGSSVTISSPVLQGANTSDANEQTGITGQNQVTTTTNDATTIPAGNTPIPVNTIDPLNIPGARLHADLHDLAEENTIHMSFPALMRIALMILFVALII